MAFYLGLRSSSIESPYHLEHVLKNQVVFLTREIAEREAQVSRDQLEPELNGRLIASNSARKWRITRALRTIEQELKKIRRMGVRARIAGFFGMIYWPDYAQKITQGFSGEELKMPHPTAENPLISVILPVYNACRKDKKHLLCALESIASQTYENIELIIVDDGSTDDSQKVCDDFLSRSSDLNARLYSKKNGGQSSARNFGVSKCKGEYIAFIDQDDEWYADKLEQVVPWLRDKRIDVLYTDSDTIDCDGNILERRIHQSIFAGWPHPKKTVEDILYKDIYVMPGLMTIKKELFKKVGGFDENLSGYEDDDLFLRLFENGKIFYLPVSTLRWRMYEDSYSFSYRMLASRTYYWKKLLEKYSDNDCSSQRTTRISLRFFWQFVGQALWQFEEGNELYQRNIDGAREIVHYLPRSQQLLFSVIFRMPLKYTMRTLVLARKAFFMFSQHAQSEM